MDKLLQMNTKHMFDQQTEFGIATKTEKNTSYRDRKRRARKSPSGLIILIFVLTIVLLCVCYFSVYTSSNDQEALFNIHRNETKLIINNRCDVRVEKNDVWDTIDSIIDTFPNSDRSGGLFLYPRQQVFLREMIQHRLIKKVQKGDHEPFRICETGFGGGHFASFVLSISESIKVTSFDKFDRPYQSRIIEHIQDKFGKERLEVVKGDSCETVPQYFSKKEFPGCDLLHGSSLCKSDNIDLIQYTDCGTILTSTAMRSLSDYHVYFGRKAQWRKLRSDKCISNITCFYDEDVNLDRKYVFALKGKKIRHKFCFAVNTGVCHNSGYQRIAGCNFKDASEKPELDFINFCPDVQLEPPI